MQTGEGVPRGTAKWTKRNHVAAVKVRDSRKRRADSRPSHGAHGNHPSSPQEEEVPISKSISGLPPPVLEHPRYVQIPKLPPSSGPHIPKKSFRPTVSQTTTCPSGLTPHWRRYTMCLPTIVEC
jgi:hypothetical protein